MKVQCSQCGARFHYERNSGICPRCMEYNNRTTEGRVLKYSRVPGFLMWGAGFVLASAVVLSPLIYKEQKDKIQEKALYASEIEAEAREDFVQEISQGDPVRAGEYYITPQTAFWLPDIDTVGLTEKGKRILVVPVRITANEESPKDRQVEFGLDHQGEAMDVYMMSYAGDMYWPELEGSFLDDGYGMDPRQEQQYLIFEAEGETEADVLRVEEGIERPGTYETEITRIYKTPLAIADIDGAGDQLILENGKPEIRYVEAGTFFEYGGSRLRVEEVRCEAAAGEFTVPPGQKLVVVTLRRESETWPHTSGIRAYTVLADQEGTVYPNVTSWDLENWLVTELSDLWGYYYEYNYSPDSDRNKEEDRVNPQTVYQCYLVDDEETGLEVILPGVTDTEEDSSDRGYWQIRVPVELPAVGETARYGGKTASSGRRMAR